jgi:hypothetical protein
MAPEFGPDQAWLPNGSDRVCDGPTYI